MKSPEQEAGGGKTLPPRECAERSIEECGGIEAALEWARSWSHRPYFRQVIRELNAIRKQRIETGGEA